MAGGSMRGKVQVVIISDFTNSEQFEFPIYTKERCSESIYTNILCKNITLLEALDYSSIFLQNELPNGHKEVFDFFSIDLKMPKEEVRQLIHNSLTVSFCTKGKSSIYDTHKFELIEENSLSEDLLALIILDTRTLGTKRVYNYDSARIGMIEFERNKISSTGILGNTSLLNKLSVCAYSCLSKLMELNFNDMIISYDPLKNLKN